ncbi:MAG TPA: ANTAR domain-containing protein [Bryobacteraceae bacterium]|nr:ANTAR domain-containing protein [Bryobacteraceae bacterium]
MSALPQTANLLGAARRLNEWEATRAIGRLAMAGIELETTLDRIAGAVLGLRGIQGIAIEAGPELAAHLGFSPVWGRTGESISACATGEIKAANWSWGRYRIFFDLRECKLKDPLAFARFVAQQIGCFLNQLALLHEHDLLLRRKARHEYRLSRRKLVERARGILAERHALSADDALRMLIRMTRESHRSLRRVAQSIIFARA